MSKLSNGFLPIMQYFLADQGRMMDVGWGHSDLTLKLLGFGGFVHYFCGNPMLLLNLSLGFAHGVRSIPPDPDLLLVWNLTGVLRAISGLYFFRSFLVIDCFLYQILITSTSAEGRICWKMLPYLMDYSILRLVKFLLLHKNFENEKCALKSNGDVLNVKYSKSVDILENLRYMCVQLYMAYSPIYYQLLSQQTLQLHPWPI